MFQFLISFPWSLRLISTQPHSWSLITLLSFISGQILWSTQCSHYQLSSPKNSIFLQHTMKKHSTRCIPLSLHKPTFSTFPTGISSIKSLSPISSNTPCVLFNAPHLPYMSIKAFITGTHPLSQRVCGHQFHDKDHLKWHVTRVKQHGLAKRSNVNFYWLNTRQRKSKKRLGWHGWRERERDMDEQDFSREAAMTALLFWMVLRAIFCCISILGFFWKLVGLIVILLLY